MFRQNWEHSAPGGEAAECAARDPVPTATQVIIANRNVQRAEELAAAVGTEARAVGLAELGAPGVLQMCVQAKSVIITPVRC